jgi:translocation and assembly module TamB
MNVKKIATWTAGAIAMLILLVIVAAYLIQRNTFLHRDLLARMIQAGEKSSGAKIAIRNYRIRWLPLHLTLEGVIVRGNDSNDSDTVRPLANLPEVEIGIEWSALLHKRVNLTELVLEHPEVNLVINDAGKSNLPERPAASQAPSGSSLQVTVQHAAVRSGDIRYNNLPRKIDADLAQFHLELNQTAASDYSGNLGYSEGEITVDGDVPLRHDAEIVFAAKHTGIAFEKIHIGTRSSELNAKATMQGYSNPLVHADYQALVSTADVHKGLPSVPLAAGEIELAGSLTYQDAGGSFLEGVKTSGHFSSGTLTALVTGKEINFRSLAGDYSLEDGTIRVRGLKAETMGGVLHAEFMGKDLAATPAYQLSVSADSVSLEPAKEAAGVTQIPVQGRAHLRASAHWVSSVRNMVARADAGISAAINPAQYSSTALTNAAPLPVNAEAHVVYDAPHSRLTVTNSTLSSKQTNITAAGTISDQSALSIRARSSDLQETGLLIAVARGILNSTGQTRPPGAAPLNLHGRASLDAEIRGKIQDPRITGHAEADALEIRQARWPHIQADFDASSSSASVKNGLAQSANQGRLNFVLSTSLQHWSFSSDSPLTAQVQASGITVTDLEQLTGSSTPVSGTLSGSLSVRGTIDNPAGEGSLELQNASLWGEQVRTVAAQIHAANKSLSANFTIAAPAGNISGHGEFGESDRHYQISIDHSVLNLAQIHYLSSRGYKMTGSLGIDARGEGTLQSPQMDLALAVNQLTFRNTPVGSINAQLRVASRQARFTLNSNIAGGQINANGNAGLTAPYMVHGAFEVRSLEFGPLLAAYMPGVRRQFEGNAEVRGQIDGPLARPEEVKASVELSTLQLGYQNVALASAGPVRFVYANSVLTISQAELKGTGTDFKFGGALPLRGSAPLNVSTSGVIDLKLLTVLGSGTQSSGTVKIDLTARGALKQPQLAGTIELTKASLASDAAPVGINNVNARIAVANHRLTVQNFSGQMGGGSFSVSGFASYSPASFSLQVNGKSIRIRYPEGTRSQVDTNLTLIGTAASSTMNGRVTIDELSFTPTFDLANFIGQISSSTPSVPPEWEENMHLNVAVASSNVLALSSSQLSLQGSADLRVAGTLGHPVVLGRTTLTGGSLIFMGNTYQVQSGTVIFANAVRTEPTLNLYVTTTVEDYSITLNFIGPLDRLRTNYMSDPALPPVDIIHLLAFGKTTEQAAATATPASVGAESVIANGLASQVSNRIEKLTGISELQIDPSLGGNNSNPGARLAIQERLTSSVLFTFATDLTDTQNEVVQIKYQTRRRLSISLTRDEYGSYAIEIKTRKSF